jgi:chemotaxis family two-component system response regulator Rcp1
MLIFMKTDKTFKILLIEDNLGDIRLTQEAFKESLVPCTLHAITDGDEALKYLFGQQQNLSDEQLPDLILLDLNLPKRDGREVLAAIKQDAYLKKIPVIVLTTSNAENDINVAYNLHANSYLVKPIDFDKFIDMVRLIEQYWLHTATLPLG